MKLWNCGGLLIILVFLGSFSPSSQAQDAENLNAVSSNAQKDVLTLYFRNTTTASRIFYGREFEEYRDLISSHPFFKDDGWNTGSLLYNGIVYSDLELKLDLVGDAVIFFKKGLPFPIKLEMEKVEWVDLLESHFEYLDGRGGLRGNFVPGLYEMLLEDEISLVAKRKKILEEDISEYELRVKSWFEAQDEYFIVIDQTMQRVKNKKELLGLFEDQKKPLKTYIKRKGLNIKKNPQETILLTVEYYNQIK